jgi:hypothetical protein
MGMTWKFNFKRGVFALAIVASLAMASGANYFGDGLWLARLLGNWFG